jgi:hypothetical protein
MQSRTISSVRKHVAALAAVVALLGQAVFPHVHALDARRHAARPTADATFTRCTDACPTVLAAAAVPATPGDADHHSPSSCPLCRAQSDLRSSLLPAALVVPAPIAAVPLPPDDIVVSVVAVARSLAAPRAPPLAS